MSPARAARFDFHERHAVPQEPSGRAPLTVNRSFIRDFLAADSPCFALGLVEERQWPCGFLALRPPTVIPPAITDIGFRFGHSLLGNADFVVVQFVFHFYGFDTYNVLVNPNNPLAQTVVTTMVQRADYFFFVLNTDSSVTAFRSDLGQDDLASRRVQVCQACQTASACASRQPASVARSYRARARNRSASTKKAAVLSWGTLSTV